MGALLLDSINQPRDLKQLNEQQVKQLCTEIRQFLLENISKTGGHLASNLGVVELTVALHRVLDTPQDKIVFDVGHQCYTHKILTGRRGQFDKLRQLDGISGFPNPNESEHDAFIAGHGNTALSLAIGMAWAKKLHHEAGLVVAVIGDGAFTGGMVYEGMNNIEQLDNLLVILNDNKMSISKNVGALARYLTHLRTTTAYFDAKDSTGILRSLPPWHTDFGTKSSVLHLARGVHALPVRTYTAIAPNASYRVTTKFAQSELDSSKQKAGYHRHGDTLPLFVPAHCSE